MSAATDAYFDLILPPIPVTHEYPYAEDYDERAEVYDDVATWAAGTLLGDEAIVRRDAALAQSAAYVANGRTRPVVDPEMQVTAE